jgi:hypothetical protein
MRGRRLDGRWSCASWVEAGFRVWPGCGLALGVGLRSGGSGDRSAFEVFRNLGQEWPKWRKSSSDAVGPPAWAAWSGAVVVGAAAVRDREVLAGKKDEAESLILAQNERWRRA